MSLRTLLTPTLVTVLSLTALTPTASAASFSDVASTHPNTEAIAYVKAEGIVEGYADGTFRANQTINRAEFTKIILEATQERASCASATQTFSDVPRDAWFSAYVCRGKELGVIGGYPDGTFRPGNAINFAEAAKIIAQAQGYSVTADAAVWYRGSVEALGERKAIPVSIDSFEKKLTRGEMAEMIWRLKAGVTNKPSRTHETLVHGAPRQEASGWKTFNAKYFNLSFEFPQEFTIEEGPNIIYIAGPQPTPEPYGTTHYFLQLWRFTGPKTKETEIEYLQKTLLNIVQDSVNVDGTSFVRITGNTSIVLDGKREQLSPEKVQYIFFEKSYIYILGGHPQLVGGQDAIAVGNQIISTMKFSSTAR